MLKSLGKRLETSTLSKLMLGPDLIVEERALIPVVEVFASVLPKLHAGWMAASPKAVVVVIRDSETALPITGEPVSLTQLLRDLPDLAARIEHARGQIAS
ncbi:MAG: hypothetical protein ACE5KH_06265 [Candidatus Geothermarchaeales archaeon]